MYGPPPELPVRRGAFLEGPESLVWRKSSRSNSTGCLEFAAKDGSVFIRDTKDRDGPVLRFSILEWELFLSGVRRGEFDLPPYFLKDTPD